MESIRPRYPEAWVGRNVEMHNAYHESGKVVDVNEYGITYEADGDPDRIFFVPWSSLGAISQPRRRLPEERG